MTNVFPVTVHNDMTISIPYRVYQKYNIDKHDVLLLVDRQDQLALYTKEVYLKNISDKPLSVSKGRHQ